MRSRIDRLAWAAAGLALAAFALCMALGAWPARWPLLCAACAALAAGAAFVSGLARRSPAFAVFAVTLAVLAAQPQPLDAWDTTATARLSLQIIRRGSLFFESPAEFGLERLPYYLIASHGRYVSRYSPVPALMAAPFNLIAAAGALEATPANIARLEHVDAAILTALGVALLFCALRALVPLRAAVLATAVYVLGTGVLPLLGRALWGSTGSALGFSLSAAALFGMPRGTARAIALGAGLGIAVASRPVDAVIAAFFLLALLREDPRGGCIAGAVAAVPVLLIGCWNQHAFGNAMVGGYVGWASQGWSLQWYNAAEGFFGLAVSPVRGLFVFSPVLAPALWALLRARGSLRLLGAGAVAFWVLLSFWWAWDGGYSSGPRQLSELLPIFGLGLGCAARWLTDARRRAMGIALAALSIVPQLLLAYVPPSPRAEGLIWRRSAGDWALAAYPPFAYLDWEP